MEERGKALRDGEEMAVRSLDRVCGGSIREGVNTFKRDSVTLIYYHSGEI